MEMILRFLIHKSLSGYFRFVLGYRSTTKQVDFSLKVEVLSWIALCLAYARLENEG